MPHRRIKIRDEKGEAVALPKAVPRREGQGKVSAKLDVKLLVAPKVSHKLDDGVRQTCIAEEFGN